MIIYGENKYDDRKKSVGSSVVQGQEGLKYVVFLKVVFVKQLIFCLHSVIPSKTHSVSRTNMLNTFLSLKMFVKLTFFCSF